MTEASDSKPVALAHSIEKRGFLGTLRVLATLGFVAFLVSISSPTWTSLLVGLPFVATGLWWRVWASGHLLKTKELAVSGPYRYVQNPLYFGRLCLLGGFCIMATFPLELWGTVVPGNLLALAVVLALFFGYYIPRKKRVEGGRLEKHHGEAYTTWAAHVPLVLPRLTPHGQNVRNWDRARFQELREINMVVAVSVVFVLFVLKVLDVLP